MHTVYVHVHSYAASNIASGCIHYIVVHIVGHMVLYLGGARGLLR
jgi:hypothetical protein